MVVQDKWVLGHTPITKYEISLSEAANLNVSDLILPHDQGWDIWKIHRLLSRLVQV